VLSIPLAGVVWLALRVTRGVMNSATRYGIWWVALFIAAGLPLLLRSQPEPTITLRRAYPALRAADQKLEPGTAPARRTAIVVTPRPALSLPESVAVLWGVAAILMLGRLAVSLMVLRIRKKKAHPASPELIEAMHRSLARCGVNRRIQIAVTSHGASPMVAGSWVLFPASLLDRLESAEIEQICLHEAAHLARFDDRAILLQRVIEAVLVLHPVARWIGRQIDLEREIACDDFVVVHTGEARSYASCLTHVAEMAQSSPGSPVAAAATDESAHLNRRIDMLLNKTRRAGTRILRVPFAAGLAGLVVITWLATRGPVLLAFAEPLPRMPGTLLTPLIQAASPPAKVPESRPVARSVASQRLQSIPVTVTDPGHRFVTGLDRSAFQVFEDGVEQPVTALHGGEGDASLLVVQNDQGDNAVRQQEIRAIEQRLAKLERTYNRDYPDIRELRSQLVQLHLHNDGEYLKSLYEGIEEQRQELADLNRFYSPQHPKVRDTQERLLWLEQQLKEAQAQAPAPPAGPSLFEKLRAAIDQATSAQTIVIVFDARDKSIYWPENELNAMIRDSKSPIYSIAVGQAEPTSFLNLLTEATGGGSYRASEGADVQLQDIENKILIERQNQYTVTYAPTLSNGAWHRIEVRMKPQRGMPQLTAHTIPGRY
jgi:beta-lactamase regulating signal transducer with metallopeptidase domain